MQLSVNGTAIPPAQFAEEVGQHQDEADPGTAAARALVVRELLRQRAVALRLAPDDGSLSDGAVEALIAREVPTPQPDDAACQTYYTRHAEQFRQGELAMVSHILFAVTEGAPVALIREKAEATLSALRDDPSQFEAIARSLSNCPSGQTGGSLGQLQRGDAVPEFDAAIFGGSAPGILPRLVKTRFGFHIVRIDGRVAGEILPFDAVRPRIERFLAERVRHKALQQYLTMLASQADIGGVSFETVSSPLLR